MFPANAASARGTFATAGREIVPDDEWRRRERDDLVAALKRSGGLIYGPNGAAELLGCSQRLSRTRHSSAENSQQSVLTS
jgi:hypothetical protein